MKYIKSKTLGTELYDLFEHAFYDKIERGESSEIWDEVWTPIKRCLDNDIYQQILWRVRTYEIFLG